jgi:hypothetical protein
MIALIKASVKAYLEMTFIKDSKPNRHPWKEYSLRR